MKKHTKLFKDFLKDIGITKVRVRNGKNTECDMGNNIIYFDKSWFKTQGELKEIENALKDIYKEKNFDIKISLATFGFFHELGHIASKVELKNLDRSLVSYAKQVEKITKNNNSSSENLMREYRKLKLEKLADRYGYAIYKAFENKAIKLDKALKSVC
jgi:hypothetical protein